MPEQGKVASKGLSRRVVPKTSAHARRLVSDWLTVETAQTHCRKLSKDKKVFASRVGQVRLPNQMWLGASYWTEDDFASASRRLR